MVGKLTRIDVRIDSEAVTRDSLTALLPADVELVAAEQRQTDMADMTQAFMTNLTAMSLLAMLVGLFLIYNCVSFAVLQRRTLLGTLRALGVTREETLKLILVEAVLLGVVGALVGLLAGIWLAELLLELVSRSINDLYFRVSVTDVNISAWSIAKGFVAGVGATVLASAVPADRGRSCTAVTRASALLAGITEPANGCVACGRWCLFVCHCDASCCCLWRKSDSGACCIVRSHHRDCASDTATGRPVGARPGRCCSGVGRCFGSIVRAGCTKRAVADRELPS